jgi:uncharacterized protein YdhG (YjbR/CyaY superfamily)
MKERSRNVSSDEIDQYLLALDEPKRSTLEALRRMIAEEIPEAEQGLSYGAPVFRIGGRPIAGVSAARHHLSYRPHRGGFSASKGAVKMPVDTPLPVELVRTLIQLRRREANV